MASSCSRLAFVLGALIGSALMLKAAEIKATGFFHTQQVDGRWILVDPKGEPFISTGVDGVRFRADHLRDSDACPYSDAVVAKYGSVEKWRMATVRQFSGWGFNTLGARSDDDLAKLDIEGRHLAYTPVIDFGAGYIQQKIAGASSTESWQKGIFADVFNSDFETFVQQRAKEVCTPLKDDPNLLGWFTDNEMRWGPDWRGHDELLVLFLNFPLHAPGREAALGLLRERYPDIAKFNAVWGTTFASWDDAGKATPFVTPAGIDRRQLTAQNAEVNRTATTDSARAFISDCDAFLALLAERYFRLTTEAVKRADPNHLVIGCRFAYVPAPPVVAAAGKYLDVISLNCYGFDPGEILDTYAKQGKPLLIGEYGFRAKDSGLPNTRGAGPLLDTQEQRATAFDTYTRIALSNPNLVGYQWFKYTDEPKEGRFDGENSNYGLVTITDKPYGPLITKMSEVNHAAVELHRSPVGR